MITGMDKTQTTARACHAARTFRQMSRAQLAQELERSTGRDWSEYKVARTEEGRRPVDVETLQALSAILDVSLEFLLEGPRSMNSTTRK